MEYTSNIILNEIQISLTSDELSENAKLMFSDIGEKIIKTYKLSNYRENINKMGIDNMVNNWKNSVNVDNLFIFFCECYKSGVNKGINIFDLIENLDSKKMDDYRIRINKILESFESIYGKSKMWDEILRLFSEALKNRR